MTSTAALWSVYRGRIIAAWAIAAIKPLGTQQRAMLRSRERHLVIG